MVEVAITFLAVSPFLAMIAGVSWVLATAAGCQ